MKQHDYIIIYEEFNFVCEFNCVQYSNSYDILTWLVCHICVKETTYRYCFKKVVIKTTMKYKSVQKFYLC